MILRKFKTVIGLKKSPFKLINEGNYLEGYSLLVDSRTKKNPKMAAGPVEWWEAIGKHQYDFLVRKGLKPKHKMLDIGCSTLRGGRYFISYLNKGNYHGMDISKQAISYAKKTVRKEGLSEKNPTLIVNKNLKFREFSGNKFDFILAQSVFTHLPKNYIEEGIKHISNIMDETSVFYFTYNKEEKDMENDTIGFSYPFSFFKKMSNKYKFHIEDVTEDYNHPRGCQSMIKLTKI